MSIYKKCDIRGVFGSELQLYHAKRLGEAVAALRGAGTVLTGGDGRVSTPILKQALINSLVQAGCRVVDLGTVPTPIFYFARLRLGIETGLMVTASHNPGGDNGFKITLGPLPITPEEMSELAKLMETGKFTPANKAGSCEQVDMLPAYLEFARQQAPHLAGLKVIIDCGNGMAGLTARSIWEATGAQVNYLLEEVDGRFPIHVPNPALLSNLNLLRQTVIEQQADLGVAYDGDADRVAFVDNQGRPVVNDKAIVIFARRALRQGPAPIVYDQKCSRIVPDQIRALGGQPVMEQSGHTFIKSAFLRHAAPYAGELSGHHFFRSLMGDDGVIASLYFAGILSESGKPLSKLVDDIPTYPITPDLRLPMDSDVIQQVMVDLENSLKYEAKISKLDGLRMEFQDGWGLIRASVTEPMITARFEGVNREALKRILARIEQAVPALRGRMSGMDTRPLKGGDDE